MSLLFGLILAFLAIFSVSLQRTYAKIPAKELRRRARAGDSVATGLYRAVAYGYSLRSFLWTLVIIFNAIFYIFIARTTDIWFAVLACGIVLWFSFVWMPASDASTLASKVAAKVAPAIAWVLQYLHPLFDRIGRFIQKHRPLHVHTGAYEKEDLVDLLKRQSLQADNRMTIATIETAMHALTFADKLVHDVLTPRRVVKAVSSDEALGPILLTELHASGFSRFPVYEGKKDNIVGVLYLRDVIKARAGGKVSSLMHKQVCYVHEQQNLEKALHAILKTHQQLFIVVNGFEEYVGVVTIEDIMEEIVGRQIVDEFDQYEDMRAVAASLAKKDKKEHDHPAGTTEETPEVVE